MIAVRLMGGLGNQLFQYAAGRRLALRHGAELVLDLGWFRYEGRNVRTPRSFELNEWDLNARTVVIHPDTIAGWERRGRTLFPRKRMHVIRQPDADFGIDERVLHAKDGVLLLGYWQSEQYFLDVADVVREELRVASAATPDYAEFDRLTRTSNAAAVHVRRGDYVSDPLTHAVHGSLDEAYYRRSLELVQNRVDRPVFLAFSDDPEWVEQTLATELPLTVVSGADAHQELRLMSLCRHHVIANSSFSWWGAWLGESQGSVVVAPERWFADARFDTRSIVPERWMRV